MIITCEKCQTSFEIDPSQIKEEGSRVKCSQCKEIFMIYREGTQTPEKEPAPTVSEMEAGESFEEADEALSAGDSGLEEETPSEEPDLSNEEAAPEDETVLEEDFDIEDLEDEELAPDEEDEPEIEDAADQDQDLLVSLEDDLDLGDLNLDEDGELDLLSEDSDEPGFDLTDTEAPDEAEGAELSPVEERARDYDDTYHLPEEDIPSAIPDLPRKTNRPFLWILIVLFGLLAAYAGLYYVNPDMIPSLGGEEETTAQPDALGNRLIVPDQAVTKQTWKQNEKQGQILVITGLAKNSYPMPRSHIKLRGFLSDGQKKMLVRKTIYCGNLLTEEELRTLDKAEINSRLMRRDGDDGTNVNIAPGKSVVFMFVFDQIPENLGGYTIEVVGSQAVTVDTKR
ncbi:MAG: zinc-ribbon domain-containing protein [Deltaproteobacteria bacterium]|nr:zinc-ribbon domain-containing protein [Deltaproteobacteria bacterium]